MPAASDAAAQEFGCGVVRVELNSIAGGGGRYIMPRKVTTFVLLLPHALQPCFRHRFRVRESLGLFVGRDRRRVVAQFHFGGPQQDIGLALALEPALLESRS